MDPGRAATPPDEAPLPRSGPLVLGLDEAGRGSVLGPLVLGGFLCPEASIGQLAAMGVRDSKTLAPRRRAAIYGALAGVGRRVSLALTPARIDRAVRSHALNELEAEGFARLVRSTRPAAVAVDACDPVAERFGRRVAELAGFDGPIDARHKADRDLPVVSAASIVAKVRRDAALARLARAAGCTIGSGYPSDGRTVAYLSAAVDAAGVPGGLGIRRSWATTERVIRTRSTVPLERFDR